MLFQKFIISFKTTVTSLKSLKRLILLILKKKLNQ